MKSAVLAAAVCCLFAAAPALCAEPAAAPAAAPAAVVAPVAPAAAASVAAATNPVPSLAPPTVAAVPPPAIYAPAVASAGSLLQTILALTFVLALLAALAWAMKRYGPRASGPNTTLRLVGSLSLGGRERIVVVEVGDQWIVVGAAPGRLNALATMARQPQTGTETENETGATLVQGASGANFAEWLKQTIDKRHGK
jgi:flagellar protein FliO/FliZ